MPPKTYPLPARPVTSSSSASSVSASRPLIPASNLSVPRSPFLSGPQAASPRSIPAAYSPYSANSPKVNAAGTPAKDSKGVGGGAISGEDIANLPRRALVKENLKVNSDFIELGEGWKIHWRSWTGAPLLSTNTTSPSPDNSTSSSLPFQSNLSSSNHLASSTVRNPESSPSKRARVEDADETGHSSPVASTSSTPSLRDKLQSLQSSSTSLDVIESARREIVRLNRDLGSKQASSEEELESGGISGLIPYIEVKALPIASAKGKEKALESENGKGIDRTLWVFCIVKAEEAQDNKFVRALESLEFVKLAAGTEGAFSFAELFPALHVAATVSPAGLASLPASSFPSALILSAGLQTDLKTSSHITKIPYISFLATLSDRLLTLLLIDSSSSKGQDYTAIRLVDSIVYLPPASEAFGASGRRTTARAVRSSFRFTLQTSGIFVQPIVTDIALRPYPLNPSIPPNSPLLLAPIGIPATLIRAYILPSDLDGVQQDAAFSSIRSEWTVMLEGTGLKLSSTESWILCQIGLPKATNLTSSAVGNEAPSEHLEVLWPASLCLLDGTRPQPLRSPQSSPPRAKPPDLESIDPQTPNRSSSFPGNDFAARKRFAATLRRRSVGSILPYSDPISSRVDKVCEMMGEMENDWQRKEAAEREAEANAIARAAAAPTPTSSSSTFVELKGGSHYNMAGQPINMRTPISLGGSVTEGPSPADGFERTVASYGANQSQQESATIQHAELDHLYPSPPDGNGSTGGGDLIMGTLDQTLDSNFGFDWGEDFANTRLRSNLPQDFDDGMMMGLTDDDFSFFDDPAPPPISLPMDFGSIEPSPKLVDHFSHLTGQTSFAAAASPTSPFGQIIPHLPSPGFLGYSFDPLHMSANALGLGGTPAAHMETGSPFKTPRTPYSPFVELAEEQTSPEGTSLVLASTLSLVGTPHYATSSVSPVRRNSLFEPIVFGTSHSMSDHKYDPRKGKFGLPSPHLSETAIDTIHVSVSTPVVPVESNSKLRRSTASLEWYSKVCDPRIVAAEQLRRKRKPCGTIFSLASAGDDRACAVSATRPWIPNEVESDGFGGEDDSDGDVRMDTDYEEASLRRGSCKGELSITGDSDSCFTSTLGVSLLLLGSLLPPLLSDVDLLSAEKESPARATVTKAILAMDNAHEITAGLVSDLIVHNPSFRARTSEMLATKYGSSHTELVSAWAIQHVHDRFHTLLSNRRLLRAAADKAQISSQNNPLVLLRVQRSTVTVNTSAVRFWKPMSFEPLAGAKDVAAFVVFEEGGVELEAMVKVWLQSVTDTYQDYRLGKHSPASASSIQDGLAMVPTGSLSQVRAKDDFRVLCSQIAEAARSSKHVVVYLLTPPGPLPISPTSPIALTIQQLLKCRSAALSVLVYPIALSSALDPNVATSDDNSTSRLTRLAFSVYDQLLVPITKLRAPIPETFPSASLAPSMGPATKLFQCPSITIFPTRRTKLKFELSWPPASLEVLHRHRMLHVAYTTQRAQKEDGGSEWIALSFTDARGEIWKTMPKLVRVPAGNAGDMARVKTVWTLTKAAAESADVEWRIVVCRLGLITKSELHSWEILLKEQLAISKRALHVTIMCSDLNPPTSILQNIAPSRSSSPTTEVMRRGSSAEEGELTLLPSVNGPSPFTDARMAYIDTEASTLSYTPSRPISIGSSPILIAPLSTYIINIPRFASLVHTSLDPNAILSTFDLSNPSAISLMGLHFLSSHHSKSSTLDASLGEHAKEIRNSFIELAKLCEIRLGGSGRIPIHLAWVGMVIEMLNESEA